MEGVDHPDTDDYRKVFVGPSPWRHLQLSFIGGGGADGSSSSGICRRLFGIGSDEVVISRLDTIAAAATTATSTSTSTTTTTTTNSSGVWLHQCMCPYHDLLLRRSMVP